MNAIRMKMLQTVIIRSIYLLKVGKSPLPMEL